MNRNKIRLLVGSAMLWATTSAPLQAQPVVNQTSPGVFQLADSVEYDWAIGCTPTAVTMMMGYWDRNGYGGLITGDSSKHSFGVASAMFSSGFIDDYASPTYTEESFTDNYGIIKDKSEGVPSHLDDSIADFVMTSRSHLNLDYGWSWFYAAKSGVHGWANHRGYGGFKAEGHLYSSFTFEQLAAEIKAGRPVLAGVAVTTSGVADHSVMIVAVNENTKEYGFLAGWLDDDTLQGQGVRWAAWRPSNVNGHIWGVHNVVTVEPPEQNGLQGANVLYAQHKGGYKKHVIGGLLDSKGGVDWLYREKYMLSSRTLALASSDGHEFFQLKNDGAGSAAFYQLQSYGTGAFSWVARDPDSALPNTTVGFATHNGKNFWYLENDGSGTLALKKARLSDDRNGFTDLATVNDDTGFDPNTTLAMSMKDAGTLMVYVRNSSGETDMYHLDSVTGTQRTLVGQTVSGIDDLAAIAAWNPPTVANDDGDGTSNKNQLPALTLDTAVTGSSQAEQWVFHRYTAAPGETTLRFTLDNLTADLDMYVREGDLPTGGVEFGTFTCGSWQDDMVAETCEVADAAGKTWYVGISAYEPGDWRLTVSSPSSGGNTNTPIALGSPASGHVNLSEWQWYRYSAASAQRVAFSLTGLSDDADIYVRKGERPSGNIEQNGQFDCASTNGYTGNDICKLDVEAGEDYYIGIYGYRATPFTIGVAATSAETVNTIAVGASSNSTVAGGEWAWYRLTPPGTTGWVEFKLDNLERDIDLYLRRGELPSGNAHNGGQFNCASMEDGKTAEVCTVSASSDGGDWYVGVYGYEASNFTLSTRLTQTKALPFQLRTTSSNKVTEKLKKSHRAILRQNLKGQNLGGLSSNSTNSGEMGEGAQVEETTTTPPATSGGGGGGGALSGISALLLAMVMALRVRRRQM